MAVAGDDGHRAAGVGHRLHHGAGEGGVAQALDIDHGGQKIRRQGIAMGFGLLCLARRLVVGRQGVGQAIGGGLGAEHGDGAVLYGAAGLGSGHFGAIDPRRRGCGEDGVVHGKIGPACGLPAEDLPQGRRIGQGIRHL
jgi:hypothetical protein